MRASTPKSPALCLIAAFSFIIVTAATRSAIADHEVKVDKDVKVKVIKCKDGDCTERIEELAGGEAAQVIVGDDMAKKIVIRTVHCDGEDCEESEGMHDMVFVGDHGNIKVMTGDGRHAWVSGMGDHGYALGGGYLGVGLTELTPELREHFGAPAGAGVMVSQVLGDSPAFKAGLEVGDIITGVDGHDVVHGAALAKMIRRHDEGDEVTLSVLRDGAERSVVAAIEERTNTLHMGNLRRGGFDMGSFGHRKGPKNLHRIVIKCDSDDEECKANVDAAGLDEFDCAGSEECEVKVECRDGSCTCSINGENADCAGIPGVPGQ